MELWNVDTKEGIPFIKGKVGIMKCGHNTKEGIPFIYTSVNTGAMVPVCMYFLNMHNIISVCDNIEITDFIKSL